MAKFNEHTEVSSRNISSYGRDGGGRSRNLSRFLATLMKFIWGVTWRITWVVVLLVVAMTIIWSLDSAPAARVLSGSLSLCDNDNDCDTTASTIDNAVNPGDRVLTHYIVLVNRPECTLFFDRQTIDAAGWVWPTAANVIKKVDTAGSFSINFTMVIPSDASVGLASINNQMGWYCNPLQWILRHEEPMIPLFVTVVNP